MASPAAPDAAAAASPPASPAPRTSGGARRSGSRASGSAADAAASPPRAAPEGSFLTRQGAHASASAARASAAKAAATPPFAPQLAVDPAAVLAASPRLKDRLSETEEARVKRLSVTEPAEAAAKRAETAQRLHAQEAPFKPEVTQASRKLAPKGADVAELYANTRGAKAAAVAKQRFEKHMRAIAPHRPDTAASRHSRRLYAENSAMPRVAAADAETLGRRIKALQQEKAAHLEALRAARAAEEAKTCTFRPQLAGAAPARGGGADAASVKGMDKFTARQAEARRLRAQAEADAAAAEETLRVPTAVPFEVFNAWKPFAAADTGLLQRRAESVAALSAAVAAERMAECTFRPQLGPPARPASRAASAVGSPSPGKGSPSGTPSAKGRRAAAEE